MNTAKEFQRIIDAKTAGAEIVAPTSPPEQKNGRSR
jgi:hypothetical protein